jgi:hypothetical protein
LTEASILASGLGRLARMLAGGAPVIIRAVSMLIAKEEAVMVSGHHHPALGGQTHDVPEFPELAGTGQITGIADVNDRGKLPLIFHHPPQQILAIEVELHRANGGLHESIGQLGAQERHRLTIQVVQLIIRHQDNSPGNELRRGLIGR